MSIEPERLVGRTIVAAKWVKPSPYSEEDTLHVTFSDGCVIELRAVASWDDAYLLIEVEQTRATA